MPIYLYETMPIDDGEPTRFEVLQRISEPALAVHPESGTPVRRIITAPALALKHGSRRERTVLSDDNLCRNGFSRYERVGDGTYERTGGKTGPRQIRSR